MQILYSELGPLRGDDQQWNSVVQYVTGKACITSMESDCFNFDFLGQPEPTAQQVKDALSVFEGDIGPLAGMNSYLCGFQSLWYDRMTEVKIIMTGTLQLYGLSSDFARAFQANYASSVTSYEETGQMDLADDLLDDTNYPWLTKLIDSNGDPVEPETPLHVPGTSKTISQLCREVLRWDHNYTL